MIRLEARALTLAAGGRVLCGDLSVQFRAGENWAILGANGSGKTTLLHTLAGLRAPDGGTVSLDGDSIGAWSPRQRALRIGLLFQDYPPAFPSTVLELVLTGRHPHLGRWAFEGPDDVARARSALAQLTLGRFEDRLLSTLSGGERRRVEIAALLAQDAPIGLWDEPTNHLDLRYRAEVLRQLAARSRGDGRVNLFVLHDVNAACRVCSHALFLFPDGSTSIGPIAEVVNVRNLARTYGCEFRELWSESESYYVAR
jgi:iron complex transport system ATP-binding protein